MRLRTRLALAFASLAVVPLLLAVPPAISQVRSILSKDLESRLNGARTVAESVVRRPAATRCARSRTLPEA